MSQNPAPENLTVADGNRDDQSRTKVPLALTDEQRLQIELIAKKLGKARHPFLKDAVAYFLAGGTLPTNVPLLVQLPLYIAVYLHRSAALRGQTVADFVLDFIRSILSDVYPDDTYDFERAAANPFSDESSEVEGRIDEIIARERAKIEQNPSFNPLA